MRRRAGDPTRSLLESVLQRLAQPVIQPQCRHDTAGPVIAAHLEDDPVVGAQQERHVQDLGAGADPVARRMHQDAVPVDLDLRVSEQNQAGGASTELELVHIE